MKAVVVTVMLFVLFHLLIHDLEANAIPPVTCPPNTSYGCLRICFSNCDNLNSTTEMCILPCWMGCDCIDGYVFSSATSKVCVPPSQCNVSCPPNMHFDPCTKRYRPTCATLSEITVHLKTSLCLPRCVCNEGYVFSNDPLPRCIRIEDCPQPEVNEPLQ